jgi:hypothetical protein
VKTPIWLAFSIGSILAWVWIIGFWVLPRIELKVDDTRDSETSNRARLIRLEDRQAEFIKRQERFNDATRVIAKERDEGIERRKP